jgi:DNA-binding CsgD family transcriptional regulator
MESAFDEVIGHFYEAALDSSRWADGMRGLARVAGAQASLSMLAQVNEPGATVFENIGNDPEAMRLYQERFAALDPMYARARHVPAGTWLSDWKLVGPGLAHTEWYNDFCLRFETHAVLSNLVYSEGGYVASVSVQRFVGQPAFTDEDERHLEALVPHLKRAARLFFGSQHLRRADSLACAVLETLHLAVWVIEANGTVLLCNASAERAMQENESLRLRLGRLEISPPSSRWLSALRAATREHCARGDCLLLPRSSGAPNAIMVAPCPAGSCWGSTFNRPVAVVIMNFGSDCAPSVEQVLGTAFSLSAAEARVACHIANGLSPLEISELAHTSVQTTRTQLKNVYSKAGVRRQTELARLVANLKTVGVQ